MMSDPRSSITSFSIGVIRSRGVARFYSLMIERDLFGRVVLVRCWGRIGTNGRELVEEFASETEAGQALEAVAQAKRRRGYRDL